MAATFSSSHLSKVLKRREGRVVVIQPASLVVTGVRGGDGKPRTETVEVPQAPAVCALYVSLCCSNHTSTLELLSAPLRTGSYRKMQNVTPSLLSQKNILHGCVCVCVL